MTVIALWYETTRRGLDVAVLSDQRELATNLETGETSIASDRDRLLKSAAFSSTCCAVCAGGTKIGGAGGKLHHLMCSVGSDQSGKIASEGER